MHTAGRFLESMPDYSEMQKLINYVNNFRTLPSKHEAYKKRISVSNPSGYLLARSLQTPSQCADRGQRQKLPPASAVPLLRSPSSSSQPGWTLWSSHTPKTSVTFIIWAEDNKDPVSKGWTPFVKQGKKKSKHEGWIRQNLHFLSLKDKNWGWLCITSLLHHSSASQQKLW